MNQIKTTKRKPTPWEKFKKAFACDACSQPAVQGVRNQNGEIFGLLCAEHYQQWEKTIQEL